MGKNHNGFQNLINEIKNESKVYRGNLQKLIECLFTHGGRIPYDIGKKSLNNFQKAAYNNLRNEEVHFFDDVLQYDKTDNQNIPIYFGITEYGRIILTHHLEEKLDNIFGYIQFTPNL